MKTYRKKQYRPEKPEDDKAAQMTVTMPNWLHNYIRREAIDQRRSMSAQIVVMLESCLGTEENKPVKK